jgi:hypothetical protein
MPKFGIDSGSRSRSLCIFSTAANIGPNISAYAGVFKFCNVHAYPRFPSSSIDGENLSPGLAQSPYIAESRVFNRITNDLFNPPITKSECEGEGEANLKKPFPNYTSSRPFQDLSKPIRSLGSPWF